MKKKSKTIRDKAIEIFKLHGGILRSSKAIKEGIHPRILYELRNNGIIEELQRGLYALTDLPDIEDIITDDYIIREQERNERINNFIELISDKENVSLDFRANLEKKCENISKDINNIIYEVLEGI